LSHPPHQFLITTVTTIITITITTVTSPAEEAQDGDTMMTGSPPSSSQVADGDSLKRTVPTR
jgi:hypothetical protein